MNSISKNGGVLGVYMSIDSRGHYFGEVGDISYVGGATNYYNDGTVDILRAISVAGIQEGDMVIVTYSVGSSRAGSNLAHTPTGYTKISSLFYDGTQETSLKVAYKFMGEVPDTDIEIISIVPDNDYGAVLIYQVWRGVDKNNPLDAVPLEDTRGNTGTPYLPTITPISEKSVIIMTAGNAHDGHLSNLSLSSVDHFLTNGTSHREETNALMASHHWTGGSYNPNNIGYDGDDSSAFSACSSIFALRAEVPKQNKKNSGVWGRQKGGMIGKQLAIDTADYYSTIIPPISHVGTTSTAGTTSITLPLGMQEGDVVFLVASSDNSDKLTAPADYTMLIPEGVNNSPDRMMYYKAMGAVPDTQITGLSSSNVVAYIASAFRGIDLTSTIDASAIASGADGMPNPPSITATKDSLVLAVGFLDDDLTEASVTVPLGYTLASAKESVTSAGSTVMLAYKVSIGAVEDPDMFGGTGNDSWVSGTVSFNKKPSVFFNKKNSGMWSSASITDVSVYNTPPVEFIGSTESFESTAIDLPIGMVENDVVFIYTAVDTYEGDHSYVPSGWTEVVSVVKTDTTARLLYKVMGAVPDTTVTGLSERDGDAVQCAIAFRNVDLVNPVDVVSVSTDSVNPPPITPNTDGCAILAFASTHTVGSNPMSGATSGFTALSYALAHYSYGTCLAVSYKIQDTIELIDPDNYVGGNLALAEAFTLAVKANNP